jgi:radical SAM family uncharacterized protein
MAVDIEAILKDIQKPGRYIGSEINAITKVNKPEMVKFAFAFPDLYEIGMSHVGLQILYGLLNANDKIVCERVFAPAPDMEKRLKESGTPLFSLETRTPLKDFDVVGFSLQYELHYTEVVAMLDLAGIPLLARERGPEHPLVFGGGPCAVNPEPVADFFDLIVIGDGEELLPELLLLYNALKTEHPLSQRKERFLEAVKSRTGVYVPAFARLERKTKFTVPYCEGNAQGTISKVIVKDLDTIDFPVHPIIPYIRTVHERANVEIMRGCPRQCKFCQAREVYWPVRKRTKEKIKAFVRELLANTGYNEISLLSLSVGDYPGIEDVLVELSKDLAEEQISVAFPSLRVEKILKLLTEHSSLVRKTGLTFALEAGSQHLRDSIKKDIDLDVFLKTLDSIFRSNNDTIKLYFMIGLPGESMSDVEAIVSLVRQVMQMAHAAKKHRFHVNLGVSTFVPKPHTDFETERLASREDINAKQDYLKKAFSSMRQVKLSLTDYDLTFIEALLARGDRDIGKVIIRAWEKGARLDSWAEHFNPALWQDVLRELAIDTNKYLYSPVTERGELPWSFVECRPR